MTSREIRLIRYPTGVPTDADFEMATVELPSPADGEALVKNLWTIATTRTPPASSPRCGSART